MVIVLEGTLFPIFLLDIHAWYIVAEITIDFMQETYSVAENSPGYVKICVIFIQGMLKRSATVTVATADAGSGIAFATGDYIENKFPR